MSARLLDELHDAILRYVSMPSPECADAVTAWIAATYGVRVWHCAPRLDITSPVKRCGKSRLMDVIFCTCNRPLITINISPAALVHSITDDAPTLLLDEADTAFGSKAADSHEDLRGILNAGHTRNRPYIRWDIHTRSAEHCQTFAMAALAGIGTLPDTITDRAVVVPMRRRLPGEVVYRFRDRRDGPALRDLGNRVGEWVTSNLDDLAEAEPLMPVEDRAADTWEPLFAIAELAGGSWPARIAVASLALTAEDDADTSLGARLLADLRMIFSEADMLHGEMVLEALHKIAEAPWADYFGKPLTARDLSRLLKPYGVRSRDVKIAGTNRKGYRREDLHDAWARYLPESGNTSATSATSATGQVGGQDQVAGSGSVPLPGMPPTDELPFDPVAGSVRDPLPATADPLLTSGVAEVADVLPSTDNRGVDRGPWRTREPKSRVACPRHAATKWGSRPSCLECIRMSAEAEAKH